MTSQLLLTDVRLPHGEGPVDLLLADGVVAAIGQTVPSAGVPVEPGNGGVVLPALTDAHCHVDKTIWGSGRWLSHPGRATLAEKIRHNAQVRAEWGIPHAGFTSNLLAQMVVNGTTRIRTHVDVDPHLGLEAVELVQGCAAEFADVMDIELVAFPQQGLVSAPGVERLVEEAVAAGVAVIGGIDPAGRDGDAVACLDATFSLAVRTGAAIDIHLHDPGALGAWQIALICERTRAEQMQGRVTLSHVYALGELPDLEQGRLIDDLAASGVSVVTAIPFNTALPPLRRMTDAGVVVGLGNDSIRNTWSPYGSADMLQRAMLTGIRCEARSDEELAWVLDLATAGGARLMAREPPRVEVGAPADLIVVDALNAYDAVVSVPPRRIVLRGGRVVARHGELVPPSQN